MGSKGMVGATGKCWSNTILRANCSLNTLPKVDMCTYPVISTVIQILVKCQLSSFVHWMSLPTPLLPLGDKGVRILGLSAYCLTSCHPAPGPAVNKWPSLSRNPETGPCLGVDLLRQVCGNKQNGCLHPTKQDPSSHHCFSSSQMPESITFFLFPKWKELSASLYHIFASMQMMHFGVYQGVNPMLSNPQLGK